MKSERTGAVAAVGGETEEGIKRSRSLKTEGLESIIRQQFSLSNHFPKRKEA